jgi:hypothetical protein
VSEIWALTLREEHSIRMLENRELIRIFRLERYEVAGGL